MFDGSAETPPGRTPGESSPAGSEPADGLAARHERLHRSQEPPLRRHFCPAFWDWIDHAHQAGTAFSIDKVAIELDAVDDDLATWASERPDAFFLEADAAVVPSMQDMSTWANGAGYEPAAVATFLQDADDYLVAHEHANRHVVVTHEVVAHSTKKTKIPNACIGVGVRCVTPFEMLRADRPGSSSSPDLNRSRRTGNSCHVDDPRRLPHSSRALSRTAMNVGRRRCVSRNPARCAASSPWRSAARAACAAFFRIATART